MVWKCEGVGDVMVWECEGVMVWEYYGVGV